MLGYPQDPRRALAFDVYEAEPSPLAQAMSDRDLDSLAGLPLFVIRSSQTEQNSVSLCRASASHGKCFVMRRYK
jgi:hypothetical protein